MAIFSFNDRIRMDNLENRHLQIIIATAVFLKQGDQNTVSLFHI